MDCLHYNRRLMAALHNKVSFQAGDFAISLLMAHFTLDQNLINTGWHMHKYFELGVVFSQDMKYTIGTSKNLLTCRRHEYVLIPNGTKHQRQTFSANAVCLGLIIDLHANSEERARKLHYQLQRQNYLLQAPLPVQQTLFAIIQELDNRAAVLSDAMLLVLLQQFLLSLIRHNLPEFFQEQAPKNQDCEVITVIENFIANNLDNHHSLASLATICNLSQWYLNRIFFRKYGISINKFIIRERMREAAEQLLNSNKPIKTIALNCGFQNFSYFTRQFYTSYGMPPSFTGKEAETNPIIWFSLHLNKVLFPTCEYCN
ncbi:MAG: AraC family transcriptional regulator [Lentisphaeria bacterium]